MVVCLEVLGVDRYLAASPGAAQIAAPAMLKYKQLQVVG
jgi:hypothetical protein